MGGMSYIEAFGVLECMVIDMSQAIVDLPRINPMYDVLAQRLDAIELAQKLIREKLGLIQDSE